MPAACRVVFTWDRVSGEISTIVQGMTPLEATGVVQHGLHAILTGNPKDIRSAVVPDLPGGAAPTVTTRGVGFVGRKVDA